MGKIATQVEKIIDEHIVDYEESKKDIKTLALAIEKFILERKPKKGNVLIDTRKALEFIKDGGEDVLFTENELNMFYNQALKSWQDNMEKS